MEGRRPLVVRALLLRELALGSSINHPCRGSVLLRPRAGAAVQPVLLRLESVLLRSCAEAAVGEHRPKMASALLPRDLVLEGSGCWRVPTQGARGSGDHASGGAARRRRAACSLSRWRSRGLTAAGRGGGSCCRADHGPKGGPDRLHSVLWMPCDEPHELVQRVTCCRSARGPGGLSARCWG